MRVLALGGCGQMGRVTVETSMASALFSTFVVADRDLQSAASFARRLGGKASALQVDVLDRPALLAALHDADIVVNTVGPFFRWGVPILEAAIEAGCDYIDINDDWEPTLEMLELDQRARERGVTAIVGVGASPGISNLLAAEAASRLDHVESLLTGWGGDDEDVDADAGATAALEHWLHQCSGMIKIVSGGALRDAKPLKKRFIDYPGIGRRPAWSVGHPEPVTLCRHFPGLRESVNLMWMPWPVIALVRSLAWLIDGRLLDVRKAARFLAFLEGKNVAKTATQVDAVSSRRRARAPLPPLFALAEGRREGRRLRVGARLATLPPGGMAKLTGIPTAVGLELMARGLAKHPGVSPPEAAFEPHVFLQALAQHCPAVPEGARFVDITEQAF